MKEKNMKPTLSFPLAMGLIVLYAVCMGAFKALFGEVSVDYILTVTILIAAPMPVFYYFINERSFGEISLGRFVAVLLLNNVAGIVLLSFIASLV